MTNNSKPKAPTRQPKFPDSTILRVLKPNPHKPGTIDAHDFNCIKNGGTVADALAAGGKRSYVNWAIKRGLIAVGETAKPKRIRKPRKATAPRRPRRSAGAEVQASA